MSGKKHLIVGGAHMRGKKYLIVGGTGSLGKKLIQRLINDDCEVSIYSRDEAKHWTIKNSLANDLNRSLVRYYVGDVRDTERLYAVMADCQPQYVIIAAALKHVDTCELSPDESIKTNVDGTLNVVKATHRYNANANHHIDAVLMVSTDKACSPVNVYGMCKALSERIVTNQQSRSTRFVAVRYGNVLESRGSIIPLFKYQAENSDALTVTDPNMTRFIMTLDQSVDLITVTLDRGVNGELWLPSLPAMKIGDLAELFAERYNKQIKIIGHRPGEKLHEDLINHSESVRCDLWGNYWRMKPSYVSATLDKSSWSYSSSDSVVSKNDLKSLLTKYGIFERDLDSFKGLQIEEIITNRKNNDL